MQLQTSSRIRPRVVEIRRPLGQVCGVCLPARTPTCTKQIGTVQNSSACLCAVHSSHRVEVGLKCDVIGRAVSIFRDAKRHQEQLGQGSMQPGDLYDCCLRRAVLNPVCEAVPSFGSAVTYNCPATLYRRFSIMLQVVRKVIVHDPLHRYRWGTTSNLTGPTSDICVWTCAIAPSPMQPIAFYRAFIRR